METIVLPSHHYQRLNKPERIGKFTKVSVWSFFGFRKAAVYLRTLPLDDTRLFIACPGYETNLSVFYPIYMGEIVMLGYLIMGKGRQRIFTIDDTKVIIRMREVSDEPYKRGFSSKQILLMQNDTANLFVPALKYLD